MAAHQASVLEFPVEPGYHQEQPAPEGFQPDFSGVESGQCGDPLRERLAGHKAREFRRVGLEYVRARNAAHGPRPSAVHLDEEQLRLKPSERDPDILVHTERVLPQRSDRLHYLGRGQWLQRSDIRCEVLARRQDRDGSRAVTPEGSEQGEPVAAPDLEILLKNGACFSFG
jgi:hypothetical protein